MTATDAPRPRSMARRRRALLALAAAALVVTPACSVSTNSEPVALGPAFDNLLTTTTTTTTTTVQSVTRDVLVYFLQTGSDASVTLAPVNRELDVNAGIQEILSNLFTQRPNGEQAEAERGLTSAIPADAVLVSAELSPASTILVVDTRGLFGDDGIIGIDLRTALAQIVWTATQDPAIVSAVRFENNGSSVDGIDGNGELVERPVTRADYTSFA